MHIFLYWIVINHSDSIVNVFLKYFFSYNMNDCYIPTMSTIHVAFELPHKCISLPWIVSNILVWESDWNATTKCGFEYYQFINFISNLMFLHRLFFYTSLLSIVSHFSVPNCWYFKTNFNGHMACIHRVSQWTF